VRWVFASKVPCDAATHVALVHEAGRVVAEAATSTECFADFFPVPRGTYGVHVYGGNVVDREPGTIDVDSDDEQEFEFRARRSGESDQLPANPTLVLWAYVQVTDQPLDDAIATSRRAHGLTWIQHSFLHWAAANAFAQKRDIASAVAELELFLMEEPTGGRAEAAGKAPATLQADPH